jgi:hypothetical protein
MATYRHVRDKDELLVLLLDRLAADGYRAIWQYTVGELIVRRGLERTAALGRPPFVVGVLTRVDPEQLPALASLAPHWTPARDRDAYDIGLTALLDGLLAASA